jgi:hypothetical protein
MFLNATCSFHSPAPPAIPAYNHPMQKKMFWLTFTALGLIADLALPFWWAVAATLPIGVASWWIAYRSDWF